MSWTPSQNELEELLFKITTGNYFYASFSNWETVDINYASKSNKWTLWVYDMEFCKQIYPKSIEDLETLIRMFNL
jgi:hypothetical protein